MTLSLAAIMLVVVGCSDDNDNNPMIDNSPSMDIVETAAADGRFTTLLAAATAADLVDALKSEGPLTVFAPTDDAFNALPEGTVEALLQDIDALTAILTYHVVPGAVTSAQLAGQRLSVETVQGQTVHVNGWPRLAHRRSATPNCLPSYCVLVCGERMPCRWGRDC